MDYEDDLVYEDEESNTCHICGQDIYYADECEFDRDGNAVCFDCTADMSLVRYVELGGFVSSIMVPKAESVTLLHEEEIEKFKLPIYKSYDSTNLPDFVELYEGTYRYVPGKHIKF